MTLLDEIKNPFTVTSPEDMSAEDTYNLFVNVFNDFPKVTNQGHSFLHGPRGSGKSMMFRYLMPDCQKIKLSCDLKKLPFYAIYMRVKNTELQLTELQRLEGKHASFILNEHFMVIHTTEIVFSSLMNEDDFAGISDVSEVEKLYLEVFIPLLENCGWDKDLTHEIADKLCVAGYLKHMYEVCNKLYSQIKMYLRRLAFHDEIIPYDGPLVSYLDFLLPLLQAIKKMSFIPNGPFYLLFDDADNFSLTQTKILNSWVFTRTSCDVSLKISTQLNYLTYHTVTGSTIDTPHDYSEINISTVYTASNKDKYRDRVREIVKKRLMLHGIEVEPEDFFPVDERQEEKIKEIGRQLIEKWKKGEGRGARQSDDVIRYARPDYIKSLAGDSKSSSTYSYAGFDQLVNISSGIVRFFLDAAKHMFNDVVAQAQDGNIMLIPPGTQNKIVRDQASTFLFDELVKKQDDEASTVADDKIKKLFNLIQALGGLFRLCLLSDRSERKVFSFAFSNRPPEIVREIIFLGVQYGYLHKSTIGKKDSKTGGRTRLYILNRRLAPLYTLDPTGFAGYLFFDSSLIEEALEKPDTLLRRISKSTKPDEEMQSKQLNLF